MNNHANKPVVNAVVHGESGIITAFLADVPALVVQGKSHEEVTEKLGLLLKSYIKRLNALGTDFEVKTLSLA